MTLQERFLAPESKVGKFFKNILGIGLLLCSALGAVNEWLAVIPPDFIPQWVKTLVVVCGIISFVAGKFTVKKDA